MPTYEYLCKKCGHEFEIFQSMKDDPLKNCPECRSRNSVQRLIGAGAGIIFKGSGFYETDYKRNNQTAPSAESGDNGKVASESTSDTKSGTESKSDSKTESKSETGNKNKESKKEANKKSAA